MTIEEIEKNVARLEAKAGTHDPLVRVLRDAVTMAAELEELCGQLRLPAESVE